ncbi:MAG TPA: hypothetical protein VK752_06200 [Bryobacteraceae bacterium]|jgi:hypothetical protein|nr:hypothetical protein [Bryobacteraceae bacterium]
MSLRANLTLLLICAAMPAQVTEKPLNNTDIANMIKAGLPEGTVVLAIQRAIVRGNTDFDASLEGLVALKNAGATEPILNFVVTAPTVQRYEPSTTVPGLPVPRGLYFQSTAGWNALDSVVLFPDVENHWKTNWKVLGSWDRAQENRRYVVPGRQARARVAGPRPALYLRAQRPESGWSVVRLTPQTDYRELIAKVPDMFAREPRLMFASGAPVGLDPATTADDVVTLRPRADLAPGEYLVFKFVSGQPWLIEGYAFEVGTI